MGSILALRRRFFRANVGEGGISFSESESLLGCQRASEGVEGVGAYGVE